MHVDVILRKQVRFSLPGQTEPIKRNLIVHRRRMYDLEAARQFAQELLAANQPLWQVQVDLVMLEVF